VKILGSATKKREEFFRAKNLFPHVIPDRLQTLIASDDSLGLKGNGTLDELVICGILLDDFERWGFCNKRNEVWVI